MVGFTIIQPGMYLLNKKGKRGDVRAMQPPSHPPSPGLFRRYQPGMNEMKKTKSNRLWTGTILAAILGLNLAGCGPSERAAAPTQVQPARAAATTATATATMPPSPLSVLPTPIESPMETPTDAPPPSPTPETAPPAGALAVPSVAPNFALQQSGGGMFTLSKQLDQGPVVLVFFQRGGG